MGHAFLDVHPAFFDEVCPFFDREVVDMGWVAAAFDFINDLGVGGVFWGDGIDQEEPAIWLENPSDFGDEAIDVVEVVGGDAADDPIKFVVGEGHAFGVALFCGEVVYALDLGFSGDDLEHFGGEIKRDHLIDKRSKGVCHVPGSGADIYDFAAAGVNEFDEPSEFCGLGVECTGEISLSGLAELILR